MIWGFHFRKLLYADVLPRPAHFSRKALFFLWFFSTFFPCLSWFQVFVVNFPPGMIFKGTGPRPRSGCTSCWRAQWRSLEFPYFPWKSPDQFTSWSHGFWETVGTIVIVMEFWMRRCAKIIEFLMCVSCPRTQLLPIHPTVSVRGCFAGIRPSRRISQDPVRFFCMAWWLFHSVFWVC